MLKRNPERQAEKAAQQAELDAQKAAEEFARSPAGQARQARERGDGLFQIVLPVASMTQRLKSVGGSKASGVGVRQVHVLDAIENEGWHLEHVNFVWQPTGSQSRDRLLHTGETTVMSGHLLGVYVFRAAARPEPA